MKMKETSSKLLAPMCTTQNTSSKLVVLQLAHTHSRNFEDRYCSQCKKMVPGLDHHCTWLNTCVGKSNYGRFLSVVALGVVLHTVHSCYAIYVLFLGSDSGSLCWYAVLVLSVVLFGGTSSLMSFHAYLLWSGMTTYEVSL